LDRIKINWYQLRKINLFCDITFCVAQNVESKTFEKLCFEMKRLVCGK